MTVLKRATDIVLSGRGRMTLRPADYLTTGGEGSLYKAKKTAIKLYTDPTRMVREGLDEKLSKLSALAHPYVVAPKGLVTSTKGDPLGFYMNFESGEPLPRLFTNDFRRQVGFTDADTSTLVDRMREVVAFVHDGDALLVDANELNWLGVLGGANGPEPRVIDVDSFAIGRWPGVVIMPSVRDWHTTGFSEDSDWFSWGIVTFELYTGIHPYRGVLPGFPRSALEERMKANASVFRKDVRLNRAVRDFSAIPGKLLDWYVAEFEQGARSKPPSPFDTGAALFRTSRTLRMATKGAAGSGMLTLETLWHDAADPAQDVFPCGVVRLKSGRLIDLSTRREIGRTTSHECEVVRTSHGWLVGEKDGVTLSFTHVNSMNFTATPLSLHTAGTALVRYNDRLFITTDHGLTELALSYPGKPILSTGRTWRTMANATVWFDGMGVENALGAMHLVLPFSDNACTQVRVRELDGLSPLAGTAGERFVTVIAMDASGASREFRFAFDAAYRSYRVDERVTDTAEQNIVILPKGVAATVLDDGKLDIFVPSSDSYTVVEDSAIHTGMRLKRMGNTVVALENGAVIRMSMS